jgi:hypothetical protein
MKLMEQFDNQIQSTNKYIEPTILKDGKTLRRERRKANRTKNK